MASRRTERPAEGQSRVAKEDRPTRVPLSGNRNIINVTGIDTDKWHLRWINDKDDRIIRAERGGWIKVTDEVNIGDRKVDDSDRKQSFVTKNMGAGVTAYLMKIKREWYEEDQAAKAAVINEKEAAMLKKDRDEEGRYGTGAVIKR